MPFVTYTPYPWMGGKNDVLLKSQPALLKSAKCKCVWGDTITITFDRQVDGTGNDVDKENAVTQEELDESVENSLSIEDILNGIQLAFDATGLFPGLGAIPDIHNACVSVCSVEWANTDICLFSAIPGIGDAAGVAKLMKKGAKLGKKSKKAPKTSSYTDELSEAPAKKTEESASRIVSRTRNCRRQSH